MPKTAAERKRDQRARERAAKGPVEELTVHGFWEKNREVANQDQIAELLERQDFVFAHLQAMDAAMTGSVSPDLLFPDEVDHDVKADVSEHGICEMEVCLLDFWKKPGTFQMLMAHQKMNAATRAFARYGLITAVPGHRLHVWNDWLAQKASAPSQPRDSGYTSLQCLNHVECHAQPVAVQQEIADGYKRLGKPFECHNCLSREDRSSAQASPAFYRKVVKAPEDEIHDSFGRIKD
jgi:hypothetical protein